MSHASSGPTEITDEPYFPHAIKWMGEVIVIGIIAAFLNAIIIAAGGSLVLATLLINLSASLIIAVSLFRHVDTLILERLSHTNH